ncbi:hypothetical protein HK097_002083 [Rhizophlyctis rosea]|uniref:lytic cellulose monooxygenase (C4-dehydrogenating) n=1 Tax=Rhizophlyctis rosea TaxID=64517 RepID=A0AAD5S6F9_9FUNG|nr:hypothetical protein HK097_002083 [Rhizophlyctis rosea]
MKAATLLTLAGAIAGANAHYHVVSVNGNTAALRQHYTNPYQSDIDSPVSGADIDTDKIVCGANRPFNSPGTPINIAAGSNVNVAWAPSVYHLGPSAVYASRSTSPPFQWVKVWQEVRVGNGWSSDKITANNNVMTFSVPAGMASGRWLFRIEHTGLHGASAPGGAQFYIRCFDANITGGGSSTGSPVVSLPGVFTSSTRGVVWNPYSGDQSSYPMFGGPVGTFTGGSEQPQPTTTEQPPQTTTEQPPQTTTTQQPPRTTTTTTRPPVTTTTRAPTGGAPLVRTCMILVFC